jgi:hypothetical protein
MKQVTTIICAILFAVAGIGLGLNAYYNPSQSSNNSYKSANAAPVLNWAPSKQGRLPLDLQLSLEKDTTCQECLDKSVIHDTVFVDSIVYKTKYVRVPKLARATEKRLGDSIPAILPDPPVVNNFGAGREENPADTIGPPKASIILTVDGEEVYKR